MNGDRVRYFAISVLIIVLEACSLPQKGFVYNDSKETIDWMFQGKEVLTRKEIWVKTKDGGTKHFPVKLEGNKMVAYMGNFGIYREELTKTDGHITRGRIRIEVKTNEPFIIQCPFIFPKLKDTPYFMIPGFLYGSNNLRTSDGRQPKFNYGGKVDWPNSSLFYCRADRSTHPGVLTIKDDMLLMLGINEKINSLSFQPTDKWEPGYLYNGLMLNSTDAKEDMIGFQIGYENAPKRYSVYWYDTTSPKNEVYRYGYIEGLKGETIATSTFYYADKAQSITDYSKALKAYYYQIHQPPVKRSGREEAMQKISQAIVNHSWNEKNKYFNLLDNEVGNVIGDIAWTGGMQAAYPLLKASMKLNYLKGQSVALDFINNLCSGKVMNEKAGLLNEEFREGKWQVTGWWGIDKDCMNFGDKPLHSAYLNGQAAYYILKSYELAGKKNPDWLSTPTTILKTALNNQKGEGAYPCLFDPSTGKGMDYDGFQSCWFVPGLSLLYKLTNNKKYLISAEKALEYYHTFHLKGEIYGTPMDTRKATDQEGNLAFIIGCVELHKLTGNKKYLDYGMDGLNYEYSWKFAYNTAHTNEPLKTMNWSSCGGSITSSHNVSVHQMGNLVAGEMYYLYTKLNDQYIADRLKDVCIWGLGTYNTKDNDFGFGKTGQATEQFYYTDGLVGWKPWDGGIWECSLSWASACVLLSCAEDIPSEFFGE